MLLALAQLGLGQLAPRPLGGLRHGAQDGRRQPLAVLLEDIVRRARLEALDGGEFADGAGQQDERRERQFFAHQLERLDAGEIRQPEIGQDQVPLFLFQQLEKILAPGRQRNRRRHALVRKLVADELRVSRIVFQVQDAERLVHGRTDTKLFRTSKHHAVQK